MKRRMLRSTCGGSRLFAQITPFLSVGLVLSAGCGGSPPPDAAGASGASARQALTLQITDDKGATTELRNARAIQRGGNTIPERITEFDGIEIEVGSGRVVIPWRNINKVVLTGTSEYDKQAEFTLMSGEQQTAKISNYNGLQYIVGETNLGKYEIWIQQLQQIQKK